MSERINHVLEVNIESELQAAAGSQHHDRLLEEDLRYPAALLKGASTKQMLFVLFKNIFVNIIFYFITTMFFCQPTCFGNASRRTSCFQRQ